MFEAAEKQVMLNQRYLLSKTLIEGASVRGDLFTLAVANFIKRTLPSSYRELEQLTISNPKDIQQLEELLARSIEIIVKVATEEVEYGNVYTTGQLAKLFGVSITTIHNWLKEGRFLGVEVKGKHKQTRVPDTAKWKSPAGEYVTIRDLAEKFAPQEKQEATQNEEQAEIANSIRFFQEKYGGISYEQFLQQHDLETTSYEIRRDAQEWSYLLRRVGGREE